MQAFGQSSFSARLHPNYPRRQTDAERPLTIPRHKLAEALGADKTGLSLLSKEVDFSPAGHTFGTMSKDAELRRLVEALSRHLGEQIKREQENPELEKHLISVALVPLIEKANRLGLTEFEFLDECREIWDIQTHPEKYST